MPANKQTAFLFLNSGVRQFICHTSEKKKQAQTRKKKNLLLPDPRRFNGGNQTVAIATAAQSGDVMDYPCQPFVLFFQSFHRVVFTETAEKEKEEKKRVEGLDSRGR